MTDDTDDGIWWEVTVYFAKESRRGIDHEDDDLESTRYHGRPAYAKTFEADGYEHGASGTLGLYWEDDEHEGLMARDVSIKDDDVIGVNCVRHGTPDRPDPEDIPETADEWDAGAQ